MAESKGNIQDVNPAKVKVDGEEMEVAAGAVQSVTTTVPHEADASSAPGPYKDLPINRPPVSTNQADVPIAQSLVAGAGAPDQGQDDLPNPEHQTPAPFTKAELKEATADPAEEKK
jgi:hypothetical protein